MLRAAWKNTWTKAAVLAQWGGEGSAEATIIHKKVTWQEKCSVPTQDALSLDHQPTQGDK